MNFLIARDNLIVNQRRRHLAPISVPINSSTTTSTMNNKSTNQHQLIENNQLQQQKQSINKMNRKPSQLSIHMENARRSISTLTSSSKENNTKRLNATSPRGSGGSLTNTIKQIKKTSDDTLSSSTTNSDREKSLRKTNNSSLNKKSSTESLTKIKKRSLTTNTTGLSTQRRGSESSTTTSTTSSSRNQSKQSPSASSRPSPTKERINEISRRMDSLTQLTRNTIARVEHLASTRQAAGASSPATTTSTVTAIGTNQKDFNNQLDSKLLIMTDDKQIININNNKNVNNNLNHISKTILNNGAQQKILLKTQNIIKNVPHSCLLASTNSSCISSNNSPSDQRDCATIINQQNMVSGATENQEEIVLMPSILKKKSSIDHHELSILKQMPSSMSSMPPMMMMTSTKEDTKSHTTAAPVSILKRKTSQDENGALIGGASNTGESCSHHHHHHHIVNESHSSSAPVTFSPSVVDPPTASRRRQSILKKRRSLDESEVLRRRSCSPDVTIIEGTTTADFRSILKQHQQRRSSLEELRVGSPEPQGILKRKTSRGSDDYNTAPGGSIDDRSVSVGSPEPQSILKRKSGSNSSGGGGSSNITQHVSIAAAVILAAASGAEIINFNGEQENVRPILKKKSISSDESPNIGEIHEPKPILKKNQSTDDYYCDERPKKPILKVSSRNHDSSLEYNSDNETTTTSSTTKQRTSLRTRSSESSSSFETNSPVRKLSTRTTSITTGDEELVSILKQSSCSRESSPRPRLSFCDDGPDEQQTSSSMSRSSPPPGLHVASEDDDGPGASHPGEHTFLRRPSMSPIYRSRSSGSDYDERYRKRRTIHLGEGERFFDDSNIRLRRQSMSDMADSMKTNSLGGPGGGQHLHSSSGMSVAERILRMETFLAQEQKNDKHNSNHVVRRRSSLHNKSNTAIDIIIGGTIEQEQQIKSSASISLKSSSSAASVKTIINKNNINNSNQSLSDGSQIIRSQNGGNETTSNISNHTQSQESNTTSSSAIIQNTEEQTSSNINNKQVAANNNNTNQLLLSTSSSSQSSEILNSDLFTNSKLTMSSSILLNHESSAVVGDEEESLGQEVVQEPSTAGAAAITGGGDDQLDVVINSHSFDSGCIEDDVQNVDGGAAAVSNIKEQTHDDGDEQQCGSYDRDRRNSVSSRAAAFNKQAEEHQKAAEAKKKNVSAGIERYKNRRALSHHKHSSDHSQRFNTQPVTYGEIQEAAKQNQQRNDIEEDDNDPSKLTIAERVKLFNEKMIEENRIKTTRAGGAPPPIRKRYSNSRFKTQPVTCDEVQRAQQKIINPLIASFVKPPSAEQLDGLNIKQTKDKINEHAVRMLTTAPGSNHQEMKGILKTPSTIRTINNESTGEHVCDTSAVRNSERVVVASSSSECESSGEREIRTIINNNNNSNRTVTTSSMLEVNKRVLSSLSSSTTPGDKKFITKSTSETTTQCSSSFSNSSIENEENTRKLKSQSKNNEKTIIIEINDESLNSTTSCDENILEDEIKTKMPASVDDAPGDDDDAVDNIIINSPSISIAERRAALQHAGNNDWKRRIHPIHELTAGELKNIVITTNNLMNNESTKYEESKNEIISTTGITGGGVGQCSSSILADRVFKLETASQGWKKRVEQSDAINFTVAGRMRETNNIPIAVSPSLPNIPINAANKIKKTPKPARFKTKQERLENKNSDVTLTLTRSISVPNTTGTGSGSGNGDNVNEKNGLRVSVPRADDETFTSFFTSSFYEDDLLIQDDSGGVIVTSEDLDVVTRTVLNDNYYLGRHKRIIKIQKRKHLSKNPIKSLCARTDLQNEYTEIKTGIAEKELTRINAEKIAKNSNMAIAALAGLASKEDFTAINLKKTNTANTNTINSITFSMLPYNDLMLIHIKGRRHVQARLVEPVISSINRGDNYVLLTKTLIYNYQGLYSNIIEQSRAQEIALASALNGNRQIITIHEEKNTCSQKYIDEFWKLLGHNNNNTNDTDNQLLITDAGHPDEDEIYESKIIETNMMYELIIDTEPQLIPYQKYWGCIPKIDMLDPNKIFIFDFGTELYVWNGKNSSLDRRKVAVKLAKELWQEGYDYTDCDICPINATQMLGANRNTTPNSISKKSNTRPSWTLLAKITQNMEPVLFREKFLDWPDYSRVIKVKDDPQTSSTNIIIKPLDVTKMLEPNRTKPDLILEGSHLGRGTQYYDEETNRLFEITTLSVKKWFIQEFEYFELPNSELNHFYSGDSYIIRWQYMVTVTGRELSGKPSRHSLAGRDRCAYFCWQGKNASLNEKGAAALLTVELDHERGPQIRVSEGFEPPAFLNLFNGSMIIHSGKLFDDLEQNKDIQVNNQEWRLYLCRGDIENETFLTEVPCNMRQLRSRASMILINEKLSRIIIWHGAKTLEHTKQMARSAVDKLKSNESEYFQLRAKSIEQVLEGDETAELLNILGVEQEGGRRLYMSLLNDPYEYQQTPRLFCFSSVSSGVFESNEILCPYRWTSSSSDGSIVTPYPFLQSDLYSASQPALFLLDNGHTLWLWQGWWPELDADSSEDHHLLSDQTGSGAIRWQEERRAAMQTTINYWRHKYGHHSTENEKKENEKCPAVLVWAGLEPLEFTNLFPTWCDRDDIAKINIKDGRKPGEILSLNSELERLTCCTYPASVLLQRPLPDGVDPTRLEEYLSPNHFQQMFNGLTKEQFYELPQWKQTNLKKEYGLF